MIQIEIDWVGFNELARDFREAPRRLQMNMRAAMNEIGRLILNAARANINNRTGALSASGSMLVTAGGTLFSVVIRFTAKHAEWIEFGRGPVAPVSRRFLRWTSRSGEIVFARRAGPAPAQLFLERAFMAHQGSIDRIITNAVERSLGSL